MVKCFFCLRKASYQIPLTQHEYQHISYKTKECRHSNYAPKLDKTLKAGLSADVNLLTYNDALYLSLQVNHANHLKTKMLPEIKHETSS